MPYEHRFILVIGAMRSGKSFFANELIKQYTSKGWGSIVYNLGRTTDFDAAQEVFFLSAQEHAALLPKKEDRQRYKENPFFMYYRKAGDQKQRLYRIKDANFKPQNGGIYGKAIKAAKQDDLTERLFFDSFYRFCAWNLLVLDDMKGVFRYGLKAEFLQLFSRINHAGIESPVQAYRGNGGASVVIILHSLEDVNDDLFTYVTDIYNFKYSFRPNFDRINNPIIRAELIKSFEALEQAPKYSHTLTKVQTGLSWIKQPDSSIYKPL